MMATACAMEKYAVDAAMTKAAVDAQLYYLCLKWLLEPPTGQVHFFEVLAQKSYMDWTEQLLPKMAACSSH